MAYRQSLMKHAEEYGVSRASRKYDKSRSCICSQKKCWDGSADSLACQSRRPCSHPNRHTEAQLRLIRGMRRRNPGLGMPGLWYRLQKRSCTRRPESLFRVMPKLGLFPLPRKRNQTNPSPTNSWPGPVNALRQMSRWFPAYVSLTRTAPLPVLRH